MSEAKFTKGEWLIEDTEGVFVYALNASYVNQFSLLLSGNGKKGADAIELKSNAHLIAAAPEMYEMLECFVNAVNDDSSEDFLLKYHEIKKLLAKARGEQ